MRKVIPRSIVIASSPDEHNSSALLTGRALFLGYRGTIWTHGLPEEPRLSILQNFESLHNCSSLLKAKNADTRICPKALFYGEAEKRFFETESPPEDSWQQVHPKLWIPSAVGE
jgi:hypothetical protein